MRVKCYYLRLERLTHWIDIKEIIQEAQARVERVTIQYITFFSPILGPKLHNKELCAFYVLLIYFSKAYCDSLQCSNLWEICVQKDPGGNLLDKFQSMHRHVLASVKIDKNTITDYLCHMNG